MKHLQISDSPMRCYFAGRMCCHTLLQYSFSSLNLLRRMRRETMLGCLRVFLFFLTKGLSGAWHPLLLSFCVKLLITSSAVLWCCRNGCLCKVDTESQIESQRTPPPKKKNDFLTVKLHFALKVFIFPRGQREYSCLHSHPRAVNKLKMARRADITHKKWCLT